MIALSICLWLAFCYKEEESLQKQESVSLERACFDVALVVFVDVARSCDKSTAAAAAAAAKEVPVCFVSHVPALLIRKKTTEMKVKKKERDSMKQTARGEDR